MGKFIDFHPRVVFWAVVLPTDQVLDFLVATCDALFDDSCDLPLVLGWKVALRDFRGGSSLAVERVVVIRRPVKVNPGYDGPYFPRRG
jgi:hypothetical protein